MQFTYTYLYDPGEGVSNATLQVIVGAAGQNRPIFESQTDTNGDVRIEIDDRFARNPVDFLLLDNSTGAEIHRIGPAVLLQAAHDRKITIDRFSNNPPVEDLKFKPSANLADDLKRRHGAERSGIQAVAKAAGPEIRRRMQAKKGGSVLSKRILGSKPAGKLRTGDLFAPRSGDFKDAIQRGQQAGLERLGKDLPNRRGILLRGSPSDLIGEDGETVPTDEAIRLLSDTQNNGGVGSRVAEILLECEAEKRSDTPDGRTNIGEGEDSGSLDGHSSTGTHESTLAERLAATLNNLFEDAPSSSRPMSDTVRTNLESSVPLGPADVDAYYDFHSLQIAWQDAWTAVVDGLTDAKVKELYESIVSVLPASEIDADLSEVEELQEMLDLLADTVSSAGSALSIHGALAAWEPSLADAWVNLSHEDQEYIRFLYAADQAIGRIRGQLRVLEFGGSMVPTWPFALVIRAKTMDQFDGFDHYPSDWFPGHTVGELVDDQDWARELAREVAAQASADSPGGGRLGRAERLIRGLKEDLATPYQFDAFAPGAHNYGILTTYRQKWRPVTYQAGDLAGAIALAPNEQRRYQVEKKVSRQRSRTSATTFAIGGSTETYSKNRAEAAISESTQRNISATTTVGSWRGVSESWRREFNAEFSGSQAKQSSEVKNELREATRKAAQNYRDERKVEVTFEERFEDTLSETREISNPNNELTVTYLFYELQRRFEVSERLHNVRPVILVSYDVPSPDQIDEAFVLRYDWIISKALLDDTHEPAIRYLRSSFAGDELAVEVLEEQWKAQLALVTEMKRQGGAHQRMRDIAREAIEKGLLYLTNPAGTLKYIG